MEHRQLKYYWLELEEEVEEIEVQVEEQVKFFI
jgi:hypothetical protein